MTSTLPLGSNVAVREMSSGDGKPVAAQVPLAGWYSSALAKIRRAKASTIPPATSTLPLGSNVAVSTSVYGAEAAGGRPGPALTRARFYQRQPSTEQNQRERDPPRQNQAGSPETAIRA